MGKKKPGRGRKKPGRKPDDDLDGIVEVMKAADGDVRAAVLRLARGQHELVVEESATMSAGGHVRRNLR